MPYIHFQMYQMHYDSCPKAGTDSEDSSLKSDMSPVWCFFDYGEIKKTQDKAYFHQMAWVKWSLSSACLLEVLSDCPKANLQAVNMFWISTNLFANVSM